MNALKLTAAFALALIAAPVSSQQMFKCVKGGQMTFQQMPCAPDKVGERLPVRAIPESGGSGLREGEMRMLYEAQGKEARRFDAVEAEKRAIQQDQKRRMSREDEAAWKNSQSDMNSRFSSRKDKQNALETMRMIESRTNPNVPPPPVQIHNHYDSGANKGPKTYIDAQSGRALNCNNGFCN